MKRSILADSSSHYKMVLDRKRLLCILLGVFTLILNIVLAVLRTDENHSLMLSINILSDILCGFFLTYYVSVRLMPRYRLYRLMFREKVPMTATVKEIGSSTVRYLDVDCYPVTVDARTLFLPVSGLRLTVGGQYTLWVTANMILEAEP